MKISDSEDENAMNQRMEVTPDVVRRAEDRLNSYFGEDVSSLSKAGELADTLKLDLQQLEKRLDHANSSISHELRDLMNSGDELEKKVSDLAQQQDTLIVKARETSEEIRTFELENREILTDISCVRGVTQYTLWLRLVEQVSLDLAVSLQTKDKDQIVNAYKKLKDVSSLLKDSKCVHLRNYVSATTEHWFTIISTSYVTAMQGPLDRFGWPFIEMLDNKKKTVSDLIRLGSEDITLLQDSIEVLLRIQGEPDKDEDEESYQLKMPMRLLLKPLRKRFKYHFLGSKSTNNPAKPEWFTAQLASWAQLHRQFLLDYVQPVYDRCEEPLLAIMEFAQGLVALAVEKLCLDIPLVMEDDVLLAHTIDEAIGFSRDMNSTMQYSSSQPGVLQPLTTHGVFTRWLNMERKFAFEKVDNLFMEEGISVWESEVGDSLTPRAAETFLALLLSVTERYKFLPDSTLRLHFLKLQIDLIEDFRVRLVQLARTEKKNPLSSNLCPILNTIEHLIVVLGNWAETPFFLQLQFSKNLVASTKRRQSEISTEELAMNDAAPPNEYGDQADTPPETNADSVDMDRTVFEESIEELSYLRENLIQEVVDSIFYSISARSIKYRTETKWFNLTDYEANGSVVSPFVCEMLQCLSFSLDTARRRVNTASFQNIWIQLARRMHTFLLEEVVLQNKFNLDGGRQLEFDVKKGFFPIFGEFTHSPQSYFPDLLDVLTLLTTPTGPLMLALEGLKSSCATGAVNILTELGIRNLNRDRALRVIQNRIELHI